MSFTLRLFISVVTVLFVQAGAASAEVRHSGNPEGPALVFLPGLASSAGLWQPWVEAYQQSHDIYVLSAPGFAGVPARMPEKPFLKTTVDEMIKTLRENNVEGAVLVGHSIGGLMALMIANEAPELVGVVLVVDSLPFLGGLFMPGLAPEAVSQRAQFMSKQMASMPRVAFDQQQKYGLAILTNTPAFLPMLETWSRASDQATVAQAFREVLSTDYRAALASIKVPVKVLVAHSADAPIGRDALENLYQTQFDGLANKVIQVVDDSYHFIMIDQPEVFSAALSAFLK